MNKFHLFCLVTILFVLTGCSNNEKLDTPVSFYYLNTQITYGTEESVFSYEERECKGLSTEEIVSLYLKGPTSQVLISPFPAETILITFQQNDNEILITLSDQYAQLNGLALTKANACIAQTLLRMTDANRIIISCESKSLGGESRIELAKTDLILVDDYAGKSDISVPTNSIHE